MTISLTNGTGGSATNVSVVEGDAGVRTLTFQFSYSNAGCGTISYSTSEGSATVADGDYLSASGSFSPSLSGTFAVSVTINGDTKLEGNEFFYLNVTGVAGNYSFTGTILTDEGFVQGTNGGDLIYGASPAAPSLLVGYDGNDTYVIRNAGDVIREYQGGGTDVVYTSISYALNADAAVETVSTQTNAGTEAINLIGNGFAQYMVGNFGDNVINGNGGADTLVGLKGNDTYAVGDAAAIIRENVGEGTDIVFAQVSYTLNAGAEVETVSAASQRGTDALNLTGNEFGQVIVGNFGANVLDGGLGADTLIGLAGADTFRFSTALGQGNVDAIADFESGVDRISLASAVFTGMATGTLSASNFVVGTAATTADQHIIYNQTTGQLFFDADGSGSGTAVLFATVTPNTVINAAMITVT